MTAPRILVVDDETDVEALITQKFRRRVRKGEIEFVFAQDGEHALERTADGLWAAIGRLVDVFTPQECANYFVAAGYDPD